ncbi:MAG: RNA-binding S4 domain-containing protein [Roseburia sp.]|nr:RNA-binding S4 domain-containing protein [Roseburia sp.]
MEEIVIKDEYIKLGQALKLAGFAGSGVDAKFMIEDGIVTVNGETELRRGRKIYPGDIIGLEGKQVKVIGI